MTKEKVIAVQSREFCELLAERRATHLTTNTNGVPFAAHGSEESARKHRRFLIEVKGEDANNVHVVSL